MIVGCLAKKSSSSSSTWETFGITDNIIGHRMVTAGTTLVNDMLQQTLTVRFLSSIAQFLDLGKIKSQLFWRAATTQNI
jgi:hypothetical protein